jgi:carbon storage regulator
MIGEDVVITILKVRGNQVRIGIEAPPSVTIRRDELEALGMALVGENPWTNEETTDWTAPAR